MHKDHNAIELKLSSMEGGFLTSEAIVQLINPSHTHTFTIEGFKSYLLPFLLQIIAMFEKIGPFHLCIIIDIMYYFASKLYSSDKQNT